jgi:hypothetical protein
MLSAIGEGYFLVCMPKTSSGPIDLDFCCRDADDEEGAWHFSFLYIAFVGSLQLVGLSWGERFASSHRHEHMFVELHS